MPRASPKVSCEAAEAERTPSDRGAALARSSRTGRCAGHRQTSPEIHQVAKIGVQPVGFSSRPPLQTDPPRAELERTPFGNPEGPIQGATVWPAARREANPTGKVFIPRPSPGAVVVAVVVVRVCGDI